jgi:starch synthase
MAKKPPRKDKPTDRGSRKAPAPGTPKTNERIPQSGTEPDTGPSEPVIKASSEGPAETLETGPAEPAGGPKPTGASQPAGGGKLPAMAPDSKPAASPAGDRARATGAAPGKLPSPADITPAKPEPMASEPTPPKAEASAAAKDTSTAAGKPPATPMPAVTARPTEATTAPAATAAGTPKAPLPEGHAPPATTGATGEVTGAEPAIAPPTEQPTPVRPPAAEIEVEQLEPPSTVETAATEEPPPVVHHLPSIFIVHITPEMAPVAKVGGLADVVFGLTRELAIRGNHVEIIMPKYDNMRYDHIWGLTPAYNDLWVPWYEGAIHCSVYFGFVHERKCFFIEPHSQDNFFKRGSIYGFNDDVLRYAFFARAALEFLWKAGKHPDIIHCHDWQTALVPVYLYEIYQHLGMTHPRVCLTIHNFKHQGVTGGELLRATGLHHPERFFDYHRLRDNHNTHALNILKGGIVYSNFVATVSPRYAFETKDQGQGFGLEPTLHTHHMKYGGVVNGIDYDAWNPEVDTHIPVHYSVDTIDGKYDNKRALRHRLMLADNEKPIVAFIGRLDPQKGLDLVRHAIFYSLERGAQFVLLGSSPDQGINADFWGLKRMLNDSPDCHLEIGFDEDLAHLIYAGADMMLVPSRFEPCGLTQLIAMRYGTIPVVRSIGGLADTVFDKDHSHRALHERNGYVFQDYDQAGLESALGRASACYFNHPEHFRELMKNAMRYDYSWNIPGQDYLNIYHYIRNR